MKRIFCIAPGFPVNEVRLRASVDILEQRGYQVHWKPSKSRHSLFSNDDQGRLKELKDALYSENEIIWCARGGYGAMRLVPFLLKIKPPKNRKLLIGLSDVTHLHWFLQKHWGWQSWHGPLLEGISDLHNSDQTELFRLLGGKTRDLTYRLRPLNLLAKRAKRSILGPLAGGNLMCLQGTLQTPFSFCGTGRIVLLEEVSERAYRVDRVLQQMMQAGVFKKAKAIVLGQFLPAPEPRGSQALMRRILEEWANTLSIPVYGGIPFGHGKRQRVFPLGCQARIMDHRLEVQWSFH